MQLLNEQFSFLYSDYDKTQLKNNRIHLMRQKEIREKIPAYRRLECAICLCLQHAPR